MSKCVHAMVNLLSVIQTSWPLFVLNVVWFKRGGGGGGEGGRRKEEGGVQGSLTDFQFCI